jgi:hypothetical protein
MFAAILSILSAVTKFAATESRAMIRWFKQEALRMARAGRALAAWVAAELTARSLLSASVLAALAVVSTYVGSSLLAPLASDYVARCLPGGQRGDGIIWLLWDSGLNGKAAFAAFVSYITAYTAAWTVFARWLRLQSIALSVYKAHIRRAKALREAAVP